MESLLPGLLITLLLTMFTIKLATRTADAELSVRLGKGKIARRG